MSDFPLWSWLLSGSRRLSQKGQHRGLDLAGKGPNRASCRVWPLAGNGPPVLAHGNLFIALDKVCSWSIWLRRDIEHDNGQDNIAGDEEEGRHAGQDGRQLLLPFLRAGLSLQEISTNEGQREVPNHRR